MDYELIKEELIKLKKEELRYIDNISIESSKKTLTEQEKLEIYRTLNVYQVNIREQFQKLFKELITNKELSGKNYEDIIVEFDIDKNFLYSVNFTCDEQKKYTLNDLGIDEKTFKFKLTLRRLLYLRERYDGINLNIILNNQKLIEQPIYVFCGYYDASEDCYGPCFGEPDSYLSGIYESVINDNDKKGISKNEMMEFEKDNIIIHSKSYVYSHEIKNIFNQELLNPQNKTIIDCINQTKKIIENLSYTRSPEYKEKVLLSKINELYKKVKGQFIKKELLYSGKFLQVIKEIYKLPNNNIVEKEKVIKNKNKNSVIIIPITQNKEYIITFQNRIPDQIIAEFPSGYIEDTESALEAANRELQEETGYISDDLFILDEVYTSPGIDNSKTFIVLANNCIKNNEVNLKNTEYLEYGLFTEKELKYLIDNNIMNGSMNKLAYYNLVSNTEDCNITNANKKIYKILKKK